MRLMYFKKFSLCREWTKKGRHGRLEDSFCSSRWRGRWLGRGRSICGQLYSEHKSVPRERDVDADEKNKIKNVYGIFGPSYQVDGGAVEGAREDLGNEDFCFGQVRFERSVHC